MASTSQNAPLGREVTTVGVLGGGAWGTALAIHCARMGHTVRIWARDQETVSAINSDARENTVYLKGIKCPPGITATTDMREAVEGSELILLVIPTQFIASVIQPLAHGLMQPHQILVSCSKGITMDTLETVNEVLERVLPPQLTDRLAYLSGPSFAAETAQGLPTAVTIASKEESVAARTQLLLSTPRFRCYRTTDVIGVEMGGALKNVLAIATGISDGLNYGGNARAALITRGLYEITKLSAAKGGHPLTMGGLAGMGDLVLTCTGDLSRNRTVGLRLGRGEKLADIQATTKAVAEGVPTSKAAYHLARKLDIECPIIEGIYRVIHEDANPAQVVVETMSRALKPEVGEDVLSSVVQRSNSMMMAGWSSSNALSSLGASMTVMSSSNGNIVGEAEANGNGNGSNATLMQ